MYLSVVWKNCLNLKTKIKVIFANGSCHEEVAGKLDFNWKGMLMFYQKISKDCCHRNSPYLFFD